MCRVNHKIGKNIGVIPIKLDNHYSTKEMDEILYEVNDELYFFSLLYLGIKARGHILSKLKNCAERLKELNFPLAKSKELNLRRNEILDKMRVIYKSVEKEVQLANDINFDACVGSMGKMKMSMFLKQKEENKLDEQTMFKWLLDNKLFTEIYGYNYYIASIQNEIIKHYSIKKDG